MFLKGSLTNRSAAAAVATATPCTALTTSVHTLYIACGLTLIYSDLVHFVSRQMNRGAWFPPDQSSRPALLSKVDDAMENLCNVQWVRRRQSVLCVCCCCCCCYYNHFMLLRQLLCREFWQGLKVRVKGRLCATHETFFLAPTLRVILDGKKY